MEILLNNQNELPTNGSLVNFYYYENCFDNEEIEKIIELSTHYQPTDSNVSGSIDYSYRKSKIVWMPINDETRFIYEKIIYLMNDANDKMWNFNITKLPESLQLAEYTEATSDNNMDKNGHYDWHMDVGSESSTRKLSMSIQLSDSNNYEGGNLQFMIHRSIITAPREKGAAIFFPSYLTHKVEEVTKGTRRSLVLWFHGPPLT